MKKPRLADLARHSKLAFRRMKPGAKLIERFHALPEVSREDKVLQYTYDWLLVPLSMWPVDMIGLMEHLLEAFEAGRKPSNDFIRLVDLIGEAPTEKTCSVISEHEHNVKGGDYETLIKAQHKFDFKEDVLMQYKEFREEWKWIKSQFNLQDYQGENGVIRRRM